MIPLLAPIFRGEWASYGESLACAPRAPAGARPVADLIDDPALLAGLLHRHARHLGVQRDGQACDLRAVASAWSFRYIDALLPPVAAAASLLQHAFPMAPTQVWLSLGDGAAPLRFHITHEGRPMPGADTAARYAALLHEHLTPLFAQLSRVTRIAPKILWGNVARRLDPLLEKCLALGGNAPTVSADRDHLLRQPRWGGADNPMFTVQRQVMRRQPGVAAPLTLHRQCCLYYLLPGESYCGACPLAPEFRKTRAEPAST